ncbi:PREDICTED: adenylyl-sulfate kinase 4, chloroplastic-like [Camelina sativa]|uniref:Adenylyl-sulfate kinase n=1 Tax=Camelina sativa TaxID=90675 RepID=A0ABM0UQN8_CAMSA|nr:PREDICTED: adenylyl-sulfate kinase 4, chloroplastic-like [Camelina sativa]
MDVAAVARCMGRSCDVSPAFGDSDPFRRFLRLSLSERSTNSDPTTGRKCLKFRRKSHRRLSFIRPIMATDESISSRSSGCAGETQLINGKQKNIVWHDCPVTKSDRQDLIKQKGCVIWITGLSGSGKSSLACALSRALHNLGKLSYILDGDNVRYGLNSDLSFGAEDRAENVRRVGQVAKLFADAGIICIASLISPYRRERAACRALLPEGDFIEVFMDVPLHVCEARDPKGLYKRARAGKIKGFTGVDDPYEPPLDCEIVIQNNRDKGVSSSSSSLTEMAEIVVSYLDKNGYLKTP